MAPNALTYGFVGLESDLYAQRINTIGIDRVFGMIADSVAEYNRVVDAMMAGWVSRTTMVQEYIELAGAGTLQPLTPDGNPLPVVPSGNYSVGYPLHGAGTGFGTNRITRPFLTGEEADRFTNDAFIKDADWRMRHLLASILDSSSWTYTDRYGDGQGGSKGIGNVTVQPLANGDSVTYMTRGGAQATDNHYLFQAAGIADATNPFAAARTELVEHPTNSGPFVAYVPTALVATTTALAEFVEVNDPDVAYLNRNNLPAAPYAPTTILGPGDEILGKLQSSNMWIVEWGRLPTNIFITVATGAGPFVRMREIADASLQGLFTEGFDVDGNHMGQRFLRWAGFGVANRVAATATLVGAGAYTTPTLYDAPLAI
jgi:hypothetical protein